MSDIKNKRFEMRISEDDLELLDQAADFTSMSRPDVLVNLLRKEMDKDSPFAGFDIDDTDDED